MVCFVNFLMDSFSITKKDELLLTTKSIHKIASNVFCGIYSSTSDILWLSLISSSQVKWQSFSYDLIYWWILYSLHTFSYCSTSKHKQTQKLEFSSSWQLTFTIRYMNHQWYLCFQRTYRKIRTSYCWPWVYEEIQILTLIFTRIRTNITLPMF